MLLVVNKGRSTHIIKISDFETRTVVAGFFHEGDVEHVEDILIYFPVNRDTRGGCIHLSQWDMVYILRDDLFRSRPLSNLQWFRGGDNYIRNKAAL